MRMRKAGLTLGQIGSVLAMIIGFLSAKLPSCMQRISQTLPALPRFLRFLRPPLRVSSFVLLIGLAKTCAASGPLTAVLRP